MSLPFDETPAPRHPELEAMIRAARAQPAPTVAVTLEDIHGAASSRRSVRWWGGLAAAAVVATSWWAVRDPGPAPTPQARATAVATEEPMPQPEAEQIPVVSEVQPEAPSALASASIEPLEGADEPVSNERGVAALVQGRYRIQTAGSAISVSVNGRVLEIAAASDVFVDARVEHSSFRIEKGKANWSTSEKASTPQPGPSAQQLTSQAEAAMLSGRHEDAVRLLRRLVQSHPRGPTTKAGLIDLARLEKRLGRPGRAHCAYALFSKRFPTDPRTPTVRRADDALDYAAGCRGLRPVTK